MKAGRLRHRMRIERPDPTSRDGFQGEVKNWTPVVEVDAAIDAITGREFMAADRELAGITWRITLREIPDVKVEPGWRGVDVDNASTYDFIAILPSHARNDLTLAATSGQSQP
jgi:head-tail adaptor